MGEIRLTGALVCANEDQTAVVTAHLPQHIALTRAESGCLFFDVTPASDPLTWTVEERFATEDAFHSHQERVAASDWGRLTAGIERRYAVDGL